MSSAAEYDPCETVWDFLQLKGSIGLLTLLNDGPRTFSELESEMEITSTTLSRRRVDADALGLLTVELESTEHGTKHVYTLTDMGEHLAREMVLNEITHHYKEMRQHQRQIETRTQTLIDWVAENPSELLQYTSAIENPVAPREVTELPSELDDVQDTATETDEEVDTGDDNGTSGGESDRPHSPSEQIPDSISDSTANETQGTFEDMTADETDTDDTSGESDT